MAAYGREAAYRSGNKVYGSGRSSPHVGTRLDPVGYVDRELNKYRLDNRSRLARGALSRMTGRPDVGQSAQDRTRALSSRKPIPVKPKNTPKRPPKDEFGPKSVKNPKNPTPKLPPTSPNNPDPEDPNTPGPPKVDLNGKLIPMPWEMQMNWMNAAADLARQNAQWDSDVQNSGIELGQALRELARQKIIDSRNIAGGNAGRGMTFSSGNAQDITENEAMYANANADANSWYQQILGQYGVGGTQRALAQSQFDQYAAMLQAEAARRLSEDAGSLGLGPDRKPKPKPKPKPDKPKPPKKPPKPPKPKPRDPRGNHGPGKGRRPR